jgi:hypothetical protein
MGFTSFPFMGRQQQLQQLQHQLQQQQEAMGFHAQEHQMNFNSFAEGSNAQNLSGMNSSDNHHHHLLGGGMNLPIGGGNMMDPIKLGFGGGDMGAGGGLDHVSKMVSSSSGLLPNQYASSSSSNNNNRRDSSNLFLQRLQGMSSSSSSSLLLPVGGGGGGGGNFCGGSNSNTNTNSISSTIINTNNKWIGDMTGEGDPYAENGILGPWSARSAGLLGTMAADSEEHDKKIRKKPKDQPKRPLSAYNIFFKEERNRILDALPATNNNDETTNGTNTAGGRKRKHKPHGKIGFESLAKVVGQRWQDLTADQVEHYKEKAEADKYRYKKEMEQYVSGHSANHHNNSSITKNHEDEETGHGNGDHDGPFDNLEDVSSNDLFQPQSANKRQRQNMSSF